MERYAPARVYLHDGYGRRLGQFAAAWANRVFASMDVLQAHVTVVADDPLLLEAASDEDRLLVIESTLYPLVWAGTIAGISGNPGEGTVSLEGRSYEEILQRRYLPRDFAPSGSAGAVFRQMHEAVESSNPSGVALASSGLAVGLPFDSTNFGELSLFDAWSTVCEQTGYEWWLEHAVDLGGQLVTVAHFQAARGEDRRHVRLAFGGEAPNLNVRRWRLGLDSTVHWIRAIAGATSPTEAFTSRSRADRRLSESGPISSAQRVISEFLRHGVAFVRRQTGRSPVSRGELVRIVENVRGAATLGTAAEALLLRGLGRDRTLDIEVWDDPHLWAEIAPGDVVHLSIGTGTKVLIRGYDGPAAVVAVQPMEHEGLLHLIVEVPIG